MAVDIMAQVVGGKKQIVEGCSTVGEVKQKLGIPGHTATINGDPADDDQELSEGDFMSLAPAVKGAVCECGCGEVRHA